ncbi:hypothetical protein PPL_02558 [Heterostelium album PN500]|uniref:Uncharacterized protein n=1 Tax=Heterostelium pallidum (strain ATCC 26659 / Pp 5 / PN500) TaxID=670386 RepID=D3B2E7_HETP5|nr:hypothetical protein PPL_02558 [Heterostelium album PN500]EFA84522.1 hypothetical protein PPL_02558 [Heterostelium album PN500]|eukprot:XP_020436635.1 hypothetical protein PPL_02558 [Heterostelium album PN500]
MKFFAGLVLLSLCLAIGSAAPTTLENGVYTGTLSNCTAKLGDFKFVVENKNMSSSAVSGGLTAFHDMSFQIVNNTLTTQSKGCWDFKNTNNNWIFYIPNNGSKTCLGQTCTQSYIANVTYSDSSMIKIPIFGLFFFLAITLLI